MSMNIVVLWSIKGLHCVVEPSASEMVLTEASYGVTGPKYFDKASSTLSQEMIDELRERWISYVSRYNQPFNDDDEYDDDLLEL
ncbi:hypothetical protein RND81_14G148400 [Saponaria officinalis]|uniref:Uncharacterized protein n=1 Tax=Saponaria officinalis TaxID=3572 RepID=A0AAW1GQN4_SAPOF